MRGVLRVGCALASVLIALSAFVPAVRAADTTPPTIHDLQILPPKDVVGTWFTFYAWVTDDTAVVGAAANVTRPDGNQVNVTMYGPPAGYLLYTTSFSSTDIVGTYMVLIWALDGAGNAAFFSGSFEVYDPLNDTTPPTIANVVANPAIQVSGGAVTVSATITDDTAIFDPLVIYTTPNGSKDFFRISYQTSAADSYWDTRTWNGIGTYAFAFWACDTSGHCSWAPGSFAIVGPIDTTPPIISSVRAAPSSQTVGGTVTISATVSDDILVQAVTVDVVQPDGSHVKAPMAAAAGTYLFTASWNQVGVHQFTISAVDGAGNTAAGSGSFVTRAADTTPPAISAVAANPASQIPGGSVTLTATVTDDTAVATVSVDVTQPDGTRVNATMMASGNAYAHTAAWSQAGTHSFALWASDISGHWASATGSFAIRAADATPPTITPGSPPSVYVGDLVSITATVTDDDRVGEVRLVYTPVGGTEQNVTMTASSGGLYQFTIPGQTDAGSLRYRIYAEDASGNAAISAEQSVTVASRLAPPTPASLDVVLDVLAFLIALNVLVFVAVVLLVRGRRRSEGAGPPAPPTKPQ